MTMAHYVCPSHWVHMDEDGNWRLARFDFSGFSEQSKYKGRGMAVCFKEKIMLEMCGGEGHKIKVKKSLGYENDEMEVPAFDVCFHSSDRGGADFGSYEYLLNVYLYAQDPRFPEVHYVVFKPAGRGKDLCHQLGATDIKLMDCGIKSDTWKPLTGNNKAETTCDFMNEHGTDPSGKTYGRKYFWLENKTKDELNKKTTQLKSDCAATNSSNALTVRR